MITIIEQGTPQHHNKYKTKCQCNCVFVYEDSDTRDDLYAKVISCPNCKQSLIHYARNLQPR